MKELNDKIAIITGGGSGIGKGIALRFAEEGAIVIAVGRRKEPLEELCNEIKKKGNNAFYFCADVSNSSDVKELAKFINNKFNKLDILINCAGITVKEAVLDLNEEDWDSVIDINLKSVFLCCKYLGKIIIDNAAENSYGKVLTISSVGSFLGIPTSSAYCASKGGVTQLTKVIAIEWADKNVNVNSIVPGYIETNLSKGVLKDPETRDRVFSRIPFKKMGNVKDTGEAALFLVSQKSNYITGTTLSVDGGMLATAYT